MLVQKRSAQEKTTPHLALAGLLPGKSVSRCRAFRSDSCPSEKEPTSMSTPATRPVVPASPPHRGPGRAARHPGAHSIRHRCAVAGEPIARASALSRIPECANVSVRPRGDGCSPCYDTSKLPFDTQRCWCSRRIDHRARLRLTTLTLTTGARSAGHGVC